MFLFVRAWPRASRLPLCAAAIFIAMAVAPRVARAQIDFRNTDRARPLFVEDAIAVERYGLELQVAPLRLERGPAGRYQWGIEPGVEFGVLPRTHVEFGLPLALADGPGGTVSGLAGIDLGIFHQLNAESDGLPALALRLDALLPAGGFGPDRTYLTMGALATRSFAGAIRAHANASWTSGSTTTGGGGALAGPGAREVARWTAGVAADRTFVLESTLVGAEVVLRQPIAPGSAVEWMLGAGARVQLDPRWVLDIGVGRRIGDTDSAWYATVGGAYAFGWRWTSIGGGR